MPPFRIYYVYGTLLRKSAYLFVLSSLIQMFHLNRQLVHQYLNTATSVAHHIYISVSRGTPYMRPSSLMASVVKFE